MRGLPLLVMKSIARPLLLLATLLVPVAVQAQSSDSGMVVGNESAVPPVVSHGRDQAAWGTSDTSVLTLEASGFAPVASGGTHSTSTPGGYLYRTAGTVFFDHSVTLPSGSEIVSMEMEACDDDPLARVDAYLFVTQALASSSTNPIAIGTTDAGVGGCQFAFGAPSSPVLIDNYTRRYRVRAAIRGADSATRLGAVRIYYRLKVSDAPGFATFNDVPVGSALHQYVEAVAAAGITAGCGSGNFCPNDPITRGQMAVFLAKALGLHWPN